MEPSGTQGHPHLNTEVKVLYRDLGRSSGSPWRCRCGKSALRPEPCCITPCWGVAEGILVTAWRKSGHGDGPVRTHWEDDWLNVQLWENHKLKPSHTPPLLLRRRFWSTSLSLDFISPHKALNSSQAFPRQSVFNVSYGEDPTPRTALCGAPPARCLPPGATLAGKQLSSRDTFIITPLLVRLMQSEPACMEHLGSKGESHSDRVPLGFPGCCSSGMWWSSGPVLTSAHTGLYFAGGLMTLLCRES